MFIPTPTPEELQQRPQAIAMLKDGVPVSDIAFRLCVRRTIVFRWRAESAVVSTLPFKLGEKGFCPRCRCTVYMPCMACEIKAAIAEGCSGSSEFDDDAADAPTALDFSDFPSRGPDGKSPNKSPKKMAKRRAEIFRQPTCSNGLPSKAIRPKASDPNTADTSDERARLIRKQEKRSGVV